jgi:vancomycin permeability regulator SanA
MGFRKPMDYNAVSHQIYMSGVELNSPRNDGFVAFEIKKDLHRLKFLLDEILKDSPEFAGESEFLQEQSKKQMWRALNEM